MTDQDPEYGYQIADRKAVAQWTRGFEVDGPGTEHPRFEGVAARKWALERTVVLK